MCEHEHKDRQRRGASRRVSRTGEAGKRERERRARNKQM